MKKVLYISYDGMTDQLGQSQVIPYLRGLAEAGYKFVLLSVEKKEKLNKNGKAIAALLASYGIEWETILFSKRPPFVAKWYDQKKLNRKAGKLHQKHKFDMVHCRSYIPAEAGDKLSQKFKIPFLFDMRGFWVDERVDSGLWNLKNPLFNFLYKLYKKKERKYFNDCSRVISLTDKGKNELVSAYGLAPEKVSVIPCCVDLDHFDYRRISASDQVKLRHELSIPSGAEILSYLGSLGGWYLTEEMIAFFGRLKLKKPNAIFLLITNDPASEIAARMQAHGFGMNDFRVRAASRNEVPSFLSLSDWNIFFIKDAYSKKASSPTKQGEVMAMGIPIICNDIGDTGKIISDSGTGILVDRFDNNCYDDAVNQLELLHGMDKEKIRNAAVKYYDLKNGVIAYKKVYKELTATTS